jgi:hypothetical protein
MAEISNGLETLRSVMSLRCTGSAFAVEAKILARMRRVDNERTGETGVELPLRL